MLIEGELVAKSTGGSASRSAGASSTTKFGPGTVAAMDGNKLTVDFDKAGRKMVLDSFVERIVALGYQDRVFLPLATRAATVEPSAPSDTPRDADVSALPHAEVLHSCRHPEGDRCGGRCAIFGGEKAGPSVTMRLTDRSLYHKLFLNPELHAGEAYMDGRMSFEDGSSLRDFLNLFSMNRSTLANYPLQSVLKRISRTVKRFQQANPVGKAQQNVAHHYDLGNDFYKLFLDKGMQYSCAYFINDDDTLEEAQQNKLRLIASKLQLKPGLKILDIGSGWGDLALYLAAMEDVDVTGVTLSKEQYELSNEKARRAGLSDRVRFELLDYRKVGQPIRPDRLGRHVRACGRAALRRVLRQDQRAARRRRADGAALHRQDEPARHREPWLRKYIFPGAYSPALSGGFPGRRAEPACG